MRPMKIRITVIRGRDEGRVRHFELDVADQVVIGRHEECDLPIWDEAASRRHALVERSGDQLRLVDLGSSNGTRIEGERIRQVTLEGGERIAIGETELRVETEGFTRRETVILEPGEYKVEESINPQEADLGASLVESPQVRERLNQLLAWVDTVQDLDTGEKIFQELLGVAERVFAAGAAGLVPASSKTRELLWDDSLGALRERQSSKTTRSLVEQVARELRAIRVTDTHDDPRTKSRTSIVSEGVRSLIVVPVGAKGRVDAILYLERSGRESEFGEDDLIFATKLGQIGGMALRNAERLQTSRRLLRSKSESGVKLLSKSELLLDLLKHLERFASAGGPILIVGETGSGKELIAQHAHDHGPYPNGPFVPVNCAAIPPTLLESELFGHEKGAFTGATGRKAGMFELASQGTLFLDEIGDMPAELQPKLLRVLETGEFFRVGGRSPVSVELLVVSATHRDLETSVRESRFREDLFYRLNRFRIEAPSLRERPEDITFLAERFLEAAAKRLDRNLQFDSSALKALKSYPWPGNVRELRNVIERAGVVAPEESIRAIDLNLADIAATELPPPKRGSHRPRTLEEVEEEAIRAALRHTGGKKGEAAELLGIAWPTLRRKLKKYEIDAEAP